MKINKQIVDNKIITMQNATVFSYFLFLETFQTDDSKT